jgi:tripartite-type tricarboxylate transporter receptor subunit TctC
MDLRCRAFAFLLPCALLVCGLIAVSSDPADAQDSYPSKDIHLVVTTAAGGADDFVARTVAQRLSTAMGQPIIIENKPAGNGSVAAGEVARAPADGYTLMMVVDSTLTINPHLYKTVDYDVFRDFTPISIITRLPTVLLARADLPANNIQELIALAQAHPGKLAYASTGVGTVLHVGMEMFKIATKTNIVHVPYRSTPGALNDLMAGRIDLMLAGITSALNHNDKIKVLAITSAQRSPLLPNLPTIAESGVPGFSLTSWFALLGPPRLPQPVVGRLRSELNAAAGDPQFRSIFEKAGMQVVVSSPRDMRTEMATDSKKWATVIKTIGLTMNQ